MAVRRLMLPVDPFDERVGRKGRQQVRGGDSSLFLSLQRQGVQGVWVPEAKVEHHVPRCRANIHYLWKYYQGSGRAQVRLGVVCRAYSGWKILTAALKEMAKSGLWFWVWARHLATVALLTGQLLELKELAMGRRVEVEHDEHGRERS